MQASLLSHCLRWVALLLTVTLGAQPRMGDDGFPQLSANDADTVLRQFRSATLGGDVCFRIEIVHKPRRGESSAPLKGVLWASASGQATTLRVELNDAQGRPALAFIARKQGTASSLHFSRQGAPAQETPADALGQPLAAGLLLTPFDLQLPFTHWPQTKYAGTERSRGRPVHFFEATNPRPDAPAQVRFAIDRAYGVLVQATSLDARGDKTRLLQVEEFAKVGEQWVLGECSVRDEATRDIDLLKFTAAAIHLTLPPETFDPATLTRPAAQPSDFKPL